MHFIINGKPIDTRFLFVYQCVLERIEIYGEENQMVWKTRITTVAMKPNPKVRATCLNSFLSIAMFLEIVDDEDRSSEVMSSIMAVAASHRPRSDIVRGSSMVYTSIMR